ncbi:NUMOD4 domain-containing protein [Achromobacter sp. MFA1 R4]|uniref:NUMOD4 domain-containing protein n=1 Tax=Achromobacter sp. MFA1 R4 TaxID=1881016 RepID=UPI000953904E|nr:NUMOD4 domain-containing protein [Achromobacter sp. MFA1 R4]SIS99862.1 HNH endonuclease [Achromobacter sp. MFA1 R4]SIT27929.1 HNH endonuclease [Achromobacter sp. MFA1 R4]
MDEEWRDVLGYEGHYIISNFGRIVSVRRVVKGKKRRTVGGQVMKPRLNNGYALVTLSLDKKMKNASVHRMVAMAFCDGARPWLVVNHKNGNRSDNRADNLEWVTISQNCIHAFRVLNRKPTSLGKRGAKCPFSKPIVAISPDGTETHYAGISEASRQLGIVNQSISNCCRGKQRTSCGYRFRYAGVQV